VAKYAPHPPHLILLGGPNGAGKTTIAPFLLREELGVKNVVNSDVITEDLSGFDAEEASIAAGTAQLTRIKDLLNRRVDTAFEGTLSNRSIVGVIHGARARHYRVSLVFLWLSGPEVAVARVQERVRQGGHSVPEDTIRRRYHGGIENFFHVYRPLANDWRFYDNSGMDGPRLIARSGAGSVEEIIDGTTWKRVRLHE
jgi:predicted ABC-type ATPase